MAEYFQQERHDKRATKANSWTFKIILIASKAQFFMLKDYNLNRRDYFDFGSFLIWRQ